MSSNFGTDKLQLPSMPKVILPPPEFADTQCFSNVQSSAGNPPLTDRSLAYKSPNSQQYTRSRRRTDIAIGQKFDTWMRDVFAHRHPLSTGKKATNT